MQHLFRHILVPLDDSSDAKGILEPVLGLALAFGARVSLLRVIEPDRVAGELRPPDPLQGALHQARAAGYLTRLAAILEGQGVTVGTEVTVGEPSVQVLSRLQDRNVDLLVLTGHGQGGADVGTLESLAWQLLFQVRASLMIVRRSARVTGRSGKVLVPLDGSVRAEHVLPVAQRVAQARGVPLVLAHVLPVPEVPRAVPWTAREQALMESLTTLNRAVMTQYLADRAAHLTADQARQVCLLESRQPLAALHDLIEQESVDLVVMSAHGYSGVQRWPYGRTALNLLTYAAVSVLIVQDLCSPAGRDQS